MLSRSKSFFCPKCGKELHATHHREYSGATVPPEYSGLEKDIEVVENSVAGPLSNGFVEGTNNKIKMVKRTMCGRCSRQLFRSKIYMEGMKKSL